MSNHNVSPAILRAELKEAGWRKVSHDRETEDRWASPSGIKVSFRDRTGQVGPKQVHGVRKAIEQERAREEQRVARDRSAGGGGGPVGGTNRVQTPVATGSHPAVVGHVYLSLPALVPSLPPGTPLVVVGVDPVRVDAPTVGWTNRQVDLWAGRPEPAKPNPTPVPDPEPPWVAELRSNNTERVLADLTANGPSTIRGVIDRTGINEKTVYSVLSRAGDRVIRRGTGNTGVVWGVPGQSLEGIELVPPHVRATAAQTRQPRTRPDPRGPAAPAATVEPAPTVDTQRVPATPARLLGLDPDHCSWSDVIDRIKRIRAQQARVRELAGATPDAEMDVAIAALGDRLDAADRLDSRLRNAQVELNAAVARATQWQDAAERNSADATRLRIAAAAGPVATLGELPAWPPERIAALVGKVSNMEAVRWLLGRAPTTEDLLAIALGALEDRLGGR
jgi:hypothetical protein